MDKALLVGVEGAKTVMHLLVSRLNGSQAELLADICCSRLVAVFGSLLRIVQSSTLLRMREGNFGTDKEDVESDICREKMAELLPDVWGKR